MCRRNVGGSLHGCAGSHQPNCQGSRSLRLSCCPASGYNGGCSLGPYLSIHAVSMAKQIVNTFTQREGAPLRPPQGCRGEMGRVLSGDLTTPAKRRDVGRNMHRMHSVPRTTYENRSRLLADAQLHRRSVAGNRKLFSEVDVFACVGPVAHLCTVSRNSALDP